jgi:hypothetical protein
MRLSVRPDIRLHGRKRAVIVASPSCLSPAAPHLPNSELSIDSPLSRPQTVQLTTVQLTTVQLTTVQLTTVQLTVGFGLVQPDAERG